MKKYGLTPILSTAAVCAFLCGAPTSASALVRHHHAKAERNRHYPAPYLNQGYSAYPPGYSTPVPSYQGGPVGGLHHPTGCANCPPE